MNAFFEAVTIEKLSLYGAFQNIEVSVVAMLFNLLLLIIVEVERVRQNQKTQMLSAAIFSVLCGNAVTCLYVFFAYADLGIPYAVICFLQALAFLCNTVVSYLFGYYVWLYVNRFAPEPVKMPVWNRGLVILEAVLLVFWLLYAIPYILRNGVLIRPAGLFYIVIAFLMEAYHMVYAMSLITGKHCPLESRTRLAVAGTFVFTIGTVVAQAYIGRAPVINYVGATFGLFVFYFSAETPDYIRLMKALEELTVERKRAEAANQAKSEFLANMSHEIRTPLSAVLGMNEMIIRESTEPDITEYAKSVERAGQSLLAVINDVLDYSKIESERFQIISAPYSLSGVISDVYNMMLFRADKSRLELFVNVDPEIPDALYGDEIRIRQIIVNLMNNAIKYTREGSVTLDVRAEHIMPPPDGKASAKPPDGMPPGKLTLIITVTDTGIGIRPEDMEKLFGKFERFDMERNNSVVGAGLGLAITREIVTMMDGEITAQSAYGEGSVFTVRIPQGVSESGPVGDFYETFRRSQALRQAYRVKFIAPDANILVVDDTDVNLTVFRKLLSRTRILTDTAANGLDALALTQDIPYDLIFMDQRMTGMDGTRTLSHIRSQEGGANKETPVVCLTADAVSGARDRYIARGFTDYLAKPVDPDKLEEMIMRYLPPEKVLAPETYDMPDVQGEENGGEERTGVSPVQRNVPDEKKLRAFFDNSGLFSFRTALRNCVDAETLFAVLQDYYANIPENIRLLEAYAASGDTEQYTVRVHSLKNTSRMIGAVDLAEAAYSLEQAGDEGRIDEIREKTPVLLAAYREVKDALEPLMEQE